MKTLIYKLYTSGDLVHIDNPVIPLSDNWEGGGYRKIGREQSDRLKGTPSEVCTMNLPNITHLSFAFGKDDVCEISWALFTEGPL